MNHATLRSLRALTAACPGRPCLEATYSLLPVPTRRVKGKRTPYAKISLDRKFHREANSTRSCVRSCKKVRLFFYISARSCGIHELSGGWFTSLQLCIHRPNLRIESAKLGVPYIELFTLMRVSRCSTIYYSTPMLARVHPRYASSVLSHGAYSYMRSQVSRRAPILLQLALLQLTP